jgi:hypothetical protein
MSTKKQIGLGSLFEMDPAGGSTYVAVSMVINLTPPGRERETADGGVLDEALDVPVQAREAASETRFLQFWEPGDTDHERLDTVFEGTGGAGSQDVGDVATFRITYPHDGTATSSTAPIDTFSGWVKRLGPESVDASGTYRREVVIQRTTDITRGTRVIS